MEGVSRFFAAWGCVVKKFKPNLIVALLLAYTSVLVILFGLIFSGVDASEAYGYISTPFVALIGGTLAVAKDLLN